MSVKEQLQSYLEKQIEADAALKAVYTASKMDACAKYVTDEARKHLNGVSGYIDDAQVYKWARDFYLEGHAEQAQENKAVARAASKSVSDTSAMQRKETEAKAIAPAGKPKRKQKTEIDNQPTLFDFDFPEADNGKNS